MPCWLRVDQGSAPIYQQIPCDPFDGITESVAMPESYLINQSDKEVIGNYILTKRTIVTVALNTQIVHFLLLFACFCQKMKYAPPTR